MTRLAIHHLNLIPDRPAAQIAEAVNRLDPAEPVSERTVRRVLSEPCPTVADLASGQVAGPRGRPSVAEPFRERVATLLEESPRLATAEILRRMRIFGYSGAKTALYELVKSVRKPRTAEPVVSFEGLPGEYAQFDFGERRVSFTDGTQRRIQLFVGRLKYSRHLHVEVVEDQSAETLVRSVVACLEAWACVPLVWVFDNPRTVRLSKAGEPIVLHSYLQGLSAELHAAVVLCTPYQPQQKGSVERGVGWVKNSFLAQRSFVDVADLREQLRSWLAEVNQERAHATTGEIPVHRLKREQDRLADRRCLLTSDDYPLRLPVRVGPDGNVQVNGTPYSVDPRLVGAPAMALIRRRLVTIQVGDRVCTHQRVDHAAMPQRLDEHRRDLLATIHGERKRSTFRRQCLWELGETAQDFLERLIHHLPNPDRWWPPINRLYMLLEEHGPKVVTSAMADALERDQPTVAAVIAALLPSVPADRSMPTFPMEVAP